MARVNVFLKEEVLKAVDEEVARLGTNRSALIQSALLAFLEARRRAIQELGDVGDLTASSAILYGDAASKHRRDFATAK